MGISPRNQQKLRRAFSRLAAQFSRMRAPRHKGAVPVTGSVAIAMVKNEQDIIEPFLRHNSRFFDAVLILDNGSVDRTREIITALSRELGNVFVTDLPGFAFDQSLIATQTLRFVQSAFHADLVIFLDADEFIAAPSRAAFDAVVCRIPAGHCGLMPWQTFMPDAQEAGGRDPLARMTQVRRSEHPVYYKAVLRLAGQLDPHLTVLQGYHGVKDSLGRVLPTIVLSDLPLMHLPVRSAGQLIAKGVIGWLANAARDPASSSQSQSYQKRRIHDRVVAGMQSLSPEELCEEALIYAQEPGGPGWEANAVPAVHGIDMTRRCSDGNFAEPTALIAAAKAGDPMVSQTFTLPAPRNAAAEHTGIENAFAGAWRWEFLVLDAPPLRAIVEKYHPASVLDIGCGNGAALHVFRSCGVTEVLGVDGIDAAATVLGPGEYQCCDLQAPFDAQRRFDLVTCLEVVEHLRPETTTLLLDTIERHARDLILFSMAGKGQPGNGHINCRDMAEVLALWRARGWQPVMPDTLALRAFSTLSWFRRNLVLLRRTGETQETPQARQLVRISEMPYHWYSQKSGLRLAAFAEPYPALPKGYGLRLR